MKNVFPVIVVAWLAILTVVVFSTRSATLEEQLQHFKGAEGVERDLLAELNTAAGTARAANNRSMQAAGDAHEALTTVSKQRFDAEQSLQTMTARELISLPIHQRLQVVDLGVRRLNSDGKTRNPVDVLHVIEILNSAAATKVIDFRNSTASEIIAAATVVVDGDKTKKEGG